MLGQWLVHSASVETYLGAGPRGDTYAAAVSVPGLLDDGLIRQQNAQGEQLVESTRFYTTLAYIDVVTVKSRVTVNGHNGIVTRIRRREAGSMFAAVEHLEVELS